MANQANRSRELADLTDAQLHRHLKEEFDFTCGPISDETRWLYIEKYKDFNKKSDRAGRSTLVRTPSPPTSAPKATRKKRLTLPTAWRLETPKVTIKCEPRFETALQGARRPSNLASHRIASQANQSNRSNWILYFTIFMILGILFSFLFKTLGHSSGNSTRKLSGEINNSVRELNEEIDNSNSLHSILFALVLIMLFQFYRRFEKKKVFELVEKCTELLQEQGELKPVPILQIRDMLLAPQQRTSSYQLGIWKKVVLFIENHESRIQTSNENIEGEEFKTWKWIARI